MNRQDIWKVVVGFGGALAAAGVAALAFDEYYAVVLIAGGCAVGLLGLALHRYEEHQWTRPPRLSRGLTCSHYPLYHRPDQFPNHPYAQELAIGIKRDIYPPDFRVICNAPILQIDGSVMEIRNRPEPPRQFTRYHTGVNAVSIHVPPLKPIEPPATLHVIVFSDQRIRVLRVKTLRTKY